MSIDQRGFRQFIQAEANTFLKPSQLLLNSTVTKINYSTSGVEVTLAGGHKLSADYALVTFSVGVLQNDDVVWEPALPDWKQEAIQGMTMVRHVYTALHMVTERCLQETYTKIFLQFPDNFWFDTEVS